MSGLYKSEKCFPLKLQAQRWAENKNTTKKTRWSLKGMNPPPPPPPPPHTHTHTSRYCQWLCNYLDTSYEQNDNEIWQNCQVNQGYVTCDLYAHSHCYKFQIIILKTVEVTEAWTLLYRVNKPKFLRKSRVCDYSKKKLIRILWPLCTCPANILTLLQVSNRYLVNCRSYGDTNPYCAMCIRSYFSVNQGMKLEQ